MPPAIAKPQTDTIIFGFDSAWSDESPGAICALAFDREGKVTLRTRGILLECLRAQLPASGPPSRHGKPSFGVCAA